MAAKRGRPPGGNAWIGLVRAVDAGPDGLVEVISELRVVVADACDGGADRSGDGHAGPFSGGAGSPLPASQPVRSGEFTHEQVVFGLCLVSSSFVSQRAGLVEIGSDFDEAAVVGALGSLVQQRSGIAENGASDEVVTYDTRLSEAGGQAELRVWSCHGVQPAGAGRC